MTENTPTSRTRVNRSVRNFQANPAVDNRYPSRRELDRIIAKRNAFPKVMGKELARELGVTPPQLSAFENGIGGPDTDALPHGMGVRAYEAALARCKERKGAAA